MKTKDEIMDKLLTILAEAKSNSPLEVLRKLQGYKESLSKDEQNILVDCCNRINERVMSIKSN